MAIGAAKLGARVDAIEIDPAGLADGQANADVNGVTDRIFFSQSLEGDMHQYDLIVANILRPVLLEFAETLSARLARGGTLIISGLVSTDVPDVGAKFSQYLGAQPPVVYQRGEWRALVWKT